MISGQILATVKMFGGLQKTPKWLDISTGVALILMLMAIFNLVNR
jgi:hypothetical protein